VKLASQTPKIFINIFECSENLKEIFFNLKKFYDFFGSPQTRSLRKCEAFSVHQNEVLIAFGASQSKIVIAYKNCVFVAEETSFPPVKKSKAFENRRFSMCQNKNFDNMQTHCVCCVKNFVFDSFF
jgi:hypothetical protein